MTATTTICAVVVTHNRLGLLKRALDGLQQQTVRINKIIVIDNASTDQTQEYLKSESSLHVIRLDKNIGGAGGFSKGVEEAKAMGFDWIWLLDDDAIAQHDALELLIQNEKLSSNKTGALVSAVYEHQHIALQHRRKFNALTLAEPYIPEATYSNSETQIDTASFVGFLLNSKSVDKIGLPDARFFLAYDDTEYSLRMIKAGLEIWLVPASKIDHLRGFNGRLVKPPYGKKHYYNLRNQLIVFRLYGQAASWRLYRPLFKGFILALLSGRLESRAIKMWRKAWTDSRKAPFSLEK